MAGAACVVEVGRPCVSKALVGVVARQTVHRTLPRLCLDEAWTLPHPIRVGDHLDLVVLTGRRKKGHVLLQGLSRSISYAVFCLKKKTFGARTTAAAFSTGSPPTRSRTYEP